MQFASDSRVSVLIVLCAAEAWGGRSANRGQCAQACRMPYGLIVDGVLKVGLTGNLQQRKATTRH